MRELVINTWCDGCRIAERPPTQGATIPIQVGTGPAQELDLCEEHAAQLLGPIAELLAAAGRDAKAPLPKAPTPGGTQLQLEHVPAGTRRGGSTGGTYRCPQCGSGHPNYHALTMHLRSRHDQRITETYGTTCPLCGEQWKSLGTHVGRRHDSTDIHMAVEMARKLGDPYGIVNRLERQWATHRQAVA